MKQVTQLDVARIEELYRKRRRLCHAAEVDPTRVSAVGTMLLSLVVAESATLEWLLLRFSIIIASWIIRPAGARVSSNLILSRG